MNIEAVKTREGFREVAELWSRAYPLAMSNDEASIEKVTDGFERNVIIRPDQHVFAVKEDDTTIGSMRYFDFKMHLFGQKILAGGIGGVATDMLHKKKGVAKLILTDFLHYYKNQGAVMTTLYPFRPDFYKNMGFGFGKSLNQFKIPPTAFPKGSDKSKLKYLSKSDVKGILACYHRYQEINNGLFNKYSDEVEKDMDSGLLYMGYEEKGTLKGYFSYTIEQVSGHHIMTQNMRIHQFVFEDANVLMAFSTFFNSQIDQINRVIMNIQDENFQYMFMDPRDDSNFHIHPHYQQCSVQGTGIMYRLIDNKKFFELYKGHDFGNETLRVGFDIEDDFFEDNNGMFKVAFNSGSPTLLGEDEFVHVVVKMNIANFTSLVLNCVSLKSLLRYGQCQLSDTNYINRVSNLFSHQEAPLCMTRF